MKCRKKTSYTNCGTLTGNGEVFCEITNRRVCGSEECIFQRREDKKDERYERKQSKSGRADDDSR